MPDLSPAPKTELTVSARTLFKIVLVGAVIYLLYLVLDILFLLFVALILASLIDPLADWCEKKKIPRSLAVIATYLVLLALVSLVVALLVPVVIEQGKQLITTLGPEWGAQIREALGTLKAFSARSGLLENLRQFLAHLPSLLPRLEGTALKGVGEVFSVIGNFIGGIFSIVIVLVITFYMVVEERDLKRVVRLISPPEYQPYFTRLTIKIKEKLGAWLRGQLILSVIVGALVYIGLSILGVKYALLLALLAALFEVVPYAGPILSTIPSVFMAFTQTGGLLKPLLVLILFVVIQQIENNILVPKVMQKAVGINPLVSIVALMIGFKLAGIVGALIAIPIAGAVLVVAEDIFAAKREE